MQHFPEYIRGIYQDESITNPVEKAQLILDYLPKHVEDKDHLYAWATASLRGAEGSFLIEKCLSFLPNTEAKDCRDFIHTILIATYEALGQLENGMAMRLQQADEDDVLGRRYEDIAKAYEKMDDLNNAVKYYELYIETQKGGCGAETFTNLAEVYDNLRDYKNAARNHELAGQKECYRLEDTWENVGRALALDGQLDEALFYFKMSSKINPKNAWSFYYMGHVYQNKKDVYRALHNYTEALKLDPDFAMVYNNLAAIAYNEEGNIAEAIEHIEKALSLNSDSKSLYTLYRNLAALHKQIADYDKHEYYKDKMLQSLGFPPGIKNDMDDSLGNEDLV
jgi:tetratricopeptide (TPR) repeat protein